MSLIAAGRVVSALLVTGLSLVASPAVHAVSVDGSPRPATRDVTERRTTVRPDSGGPGEPGPPAAGTGRSRRPQIGTAVKYVRNADGSVTVVRG